MCKVSSLHIFPSCSSSPTRGGFFLDFQDAPKHYQKFEVHKGSVSDRWLRTHWGNICKELLGKVNSEPCTKDWSQGSFSFRLWAQNEYSLRILKILHKRKSRQRRWKSSNTRLTHSHYQMKILRREHFLSGWNNCRTFALLSTSQSSPISWTKRYFSKLWMDWSPKQIIIDN